MPLCSFLFSLYAEPSQDHLDLLFRWISTCCNFPLYIDEPCCCYALFVYIPSPYKKPTESALFYERIGPCIFFLEFRCWMYYALVIMSLSHALAIFTRLMLLSQIGTSSRARMLHSSSSSPRVVIFLDVPIVFFFIRGHCLPSHSPFAIIPSHNLHNAEMGTPKCTFPVAPT